MTSRELYERVGGFRQNAKFVYWREDAAYVKDLRRLGYRSAVLEGLSVWHAGSPYYSKTESAKNPFHSAGRTGEGQKGLRQAPAAPYPVRVGAQYTPRLVRSTPRYHPPIFGKDRS